MKRIILGACAGLLAMTMAAPTFAADLPRPSYKAPAYFAPAFTWSGFYVGINGGYGWGFSEWTNAAPFSFGIDTKGALLGGTIGYNMQTGVFVWGLEADLAYSWMKGSGTSIAPTCAAPGCETRLNWLATGRGRIGYAWDRWLPYITGGAAYGNVEMTAPSGASEDESRLGWTVGGGVEWAFLSGWSAKLEYLYVDLGKSTCGAATCGLATEVDFTAHLARIGLNFRF